MWYPTCESSYVNGNGIPTLIARSIRPLATMTSTTRDEGPLRVLIWIFRRGGETMRCELALTADCSGYELRVDRSHPGAATVEAFDDAIAAFQRHAALERALVADGWSLESFESQRIETNDGPAKA